VKSGEAGYPFQDRGIVVREINFLKQRFMTVHEGNKTWDALKYAREQEKARREAENRDYERRMVEKAKARLDTRPVDENGYPIMTDEEETTYRENYIRSYQEAAYADLMREKKAEEDYEARLEQIAQKMGAKRGNP
jgi:primosomal protein N''